ncbi:YceI family protein [Roseibium sp.]|uniref:YceI family protein n=1 Tax=Roseibium sp. TaxID=1936156 RepID=UPI003D0AF5F7
MTLKSLALLSCTLSFLTVQPVLAATWTVDPAQSTLGFEVQQGSSALTGRFTSWDASIEFDPDAPENADISATIRPASASTGNAQFDGTLPNGDWFDTAAFPDATFTADSVERVEGDSYRANGTLTIKGVSMPLVLDFTLAINGDTATANGMATLNRLEYGLGSGVGTDTVGDAVTVTLNLTATR